MTRFFHRLFSWRTLRRVLLVLVGLITLIALLWTEEKLRGKYEWEKYKRELEAKGERLDFAAFAPPPISDESNFFMAPIWEGTLNRPWIDPMTGEVNPGLTNQANRLLMDTLGPSEIDFPKGDGGWWTKGSLTDLKASQDYYRRVAAVTNLFPVPEKPRSPAEDVLLALSPYDSTVEELRRASERLGSRLPLDYSNPAVTINRLLPILADVKGPASVLVLRAKAELSAGNSAAAFSDVEIMLRLTDSIRDQPLLIAHLVRMALMTMAIPPIYEGLARHEWTDEQLDKLQTHLEKEDFLADYAFAMGGDCALGISMIDSFPQYYRLNPFYHHWKIAITRMFQEWVIPCVNIETRVVSPGEVRRLQEAEATEWKHATPYNVLAKAEFPGLNKAVDNFARIQVGVDLARVACALERYRLANGQYAETLDVLTPQFIDKLPHDIINGEPLHYHRTDDGRFVLYSVGWNEKDDGGVHGGKTGWDTKEGDWVWEYPGNASFE